MQVNVLTLNFWDSEEQRNTNFVRVYSTYELCKKALQDAQEEYGENVDYCISYCTIDKDV